MNIPDIGSMLLHLQTQLPYFWRLVTGFSYLMGMFFALKSLYCFKEYGELRVMMSSSTDIRKPITFLIVAVGLLWAPYFVSQAMETVFLVQTPEAFQYADITANSKFTAIIQAVGDIIELIGFISFIRGWVLLSHASQQNAQPGTFGKAITHMIGGLFAINIFGALRILAATFGVGTGASG